MAATGTEYVTLEQLKDLVTNMIQPLVDAVGTWDKSEHGNVSMAEFCENLTGAYTTALPSGIAENGTSVENSIVQLFGVQNNGDRVQSNNLGNLIGNLMLAAPNGDHTQLFGDLGDTVNLFTTPTVRSSAALTYAAESGGSTDVPVGTLSVQGEYGQVFKKTEGGTEPVGMVTLSESQIENTLTATKPFTIVGTDVDIPGIQFGKPKEEGGLDFAIALTISPSISDDPNITASDLASAKKVPMNFNPNSYALILE